MNINLTRWSKRLGALAAAAAATFTTLVTPAQAEPDYGQIGRQFSLVLQNAHYSRQRFNNDLNRKFLDCFLQSLDPQHFIFTREDADKLAEKYGTNFGDYLLTGKTTELSMDLYGLFLKRSLEYINTMEKMVRALDVSNLRFDSDRTIPRSRRKLPRAANMDELRQVWKDQLHDMILSELIRRDNISKLAVEKGVSDPYSTELSVTDKILARLKRQRAEIQEADLEDMVSSVLNAVANVYDPHSSYMGARDEQLFKDAIKASIVGIGARLKADDDGSTKIEGIVKGGPAAKCGQLKLGDRIVAIDSENNGNWTDIMYMSIDKVVDLIRGKQGTVVGLRVISETGGSERIVTVTRDEIPMSEDLASARIIDMKVPDGKGGDKSYRLGILTLPSFYVDMEGDSVHCAADVKKLLSRMTREGVQGLIVDLRFNGGGSLDEVRKMVGFFTGAGPVVQIKDSRGQVRREAASSMPIFTGELIVLTNKLSASASEIFAGAMTDYGRALIVGDDSTFGKGTVQVPRDLAEFLPYFSSTDDAGMIKVTTNQFYRINGDSTQLRGVSSDIVLPQATAALQQCEAELDYALPFDHIKRATGYVKDPHLATILPELRRRSAERVSADKDMQYAQENIDRIRKRISDNVVSLNKEKRVAENEALMARKKAIDTECKTRYASMAEDDKKALTIYRLNLTDVNAATLPLSTGEDKKEFMDEAADPEAELSESPEYPSGLDPVLRESMNILRDMIDLN